MTAALVIAAAVAAAAALWGTRERRKAVTRMFDEYVRVIEPRPLDPRDLELWCRQIREADTGRIIDEANQ